MQIHNSVSINIMAHPKRKEFIPYLKQKLGDVPVVWDRDNDVWDTRCRALQAHLKKGCRWSLTIQDDCFITDNFLEKVGRFIEQHPESESFNFYFWNREERIVRDALRDGFYRTSGMKSGLAICIRTSLIPELLNYWEGEERLYRHDDTRISEFLEKNKIPTIYPVPSLVQHRDEKSLIYKRGEMTGIRQALIYSENEKEKAGSFSELSPQ
jgi:hypothetical protein